MRQVSDTIGGYTGSVLKRLKEEMQDILNVEVVH